MVHSKRRGSEGDGRLRKKRFLLPGRSKSLAILGYCYTNRAHHLKLLCQNWRTLSLNISFGVLPFINKNALKSTVDAHFCNQLKRNKPRIQFVKRQKEIVTRPIVNNLFYITQVLIFTTLSTKVLPWRGENKIRLFRRLDGTIPFHYLSYWRFRYTN